MTSYFEHSVSASLLRRIAATALCCIAVNAGAADLLDVGDTTGGPVFQRPVEDLSALSAIGTAVYYDVLTFTASSSGDHAFLTHGDFDTFALLYDGTLNPALPLSHALIANDDFVPDDFSTSGFTWSLVAGQDYSYVVTGFDEQEFGAFSTSIKALAVAAPVPEAETWALFAMGFGVIALRARPRTRAASKERFGAVA